MRLDILASDGDDRAMQTVLSQFCEDSRTYGRYSSRSIVSHRASARRRTTRQHEAFSGPALGAAPPARAGGQGQGPAGVRADLRAAEERQVDADERGRAAPTSARSATLPAYPCLVFTSPGPRRELVVTRYDGSTQRSPTPRRCAAHIAAGARRARRRRSAPPRARARCSIRSMHFPQAIRRVDVRVPAEQLAATGRRAGRHAGPLHAHALRLRPHDARLPQRRRVRRVRRQVRQPCSSSRCSPSSDQLLDLFSRIFLVVNVDCTKRDVGPDGKLVPSLEQAHPELILRGVRAAGDVGAA